MTQSQIINAYKTLPELSEISGISKKEQWELYKLRNVLKTHFEFQVEQENKIREKYSEYADKDGNLFGEYAERFVNDMKEIADLEVELGEFDKPKIRIQDGMTLKMIDPLDNFVEFLQPEE